MISADGNDMLELVFVLVVVVVDVEVDGAIAAVDRSLLNLLSVTDLTIGSEAPLSVLIEDMY